MIMESTGRPQRSILLEVERIIFRSPDNGTVILSGRLEGGKTRQVIGSMPAPAAGSIVKASGFWKRHDRYGWQFKAEDLEVMCPDPQRDDREGLQCRIASVRILREDTGFCRASGIAPDGTKVSLSGRLRNMKRDTDIFALGQWHEDGRYGREFRVRQWEYHRDERPGFLRRTMDMAAEIRRRGDTASRIMEFPWSDVELKDGMAVIPYPKGGTTWCAMPGARESYNLIRSYLAGRLPALQVCMDSSGTGTVLNAGVIRDAVSLMHVRYTLEYGRMETREKNLDVMDTVGGMSPEATREFVPRDVSGYLDFLQERQSEYFNVIPIEEYNGGSREGAFLFTLQIGGRPCIVWENTNPSRATFVFPCTDEDYDSRIQAVCSFIADERKGKRRYLHSDASAVTFGEKPILLVHNTLESWSERLMAATAQNEE